jgi:hypothetical protein
MATTTKTPSALVAIGETLQETLQGNPAVRSAVYSAGATLVLGLLAKSYPRLYKVALGALAVSAISGGVAALKSATRGR